MKNRIILLLCQLLLPVGAILAQDIYNGDFKKDVSKSQYGPCPVFDDDFMCNWFRSHGTPDWEATNGWRVHLRAQELICFDKQTVPNPYGEGIVGGYNFRKDVIYTIKITYQVIGTSQQAQLHVWAANNMTEGSIYSQCGFGGGGGQPYDICESETPTVISKQNIATSGTLSPGAQVTSTTTLIPNQNYSQLWIYTTPVSGYSDVAIAKVEISTCQPGQSITYDDYSSNKIPSGIRNWWQETIILGQSAVTTNHYDQNTTIVGERIFMEPDSKGEVDNQHYFLMVAVPSCKDLSPRPNTCPLLKPGRSGEQQKEKELLSESGSDNIQIFPNPSTGSITISTSKTGNYDISVIDYMGSIVYESQIINNAKHSIRLNENIPNGNYIIRVAGSDINHISKITLMR